MATPEAQRRARAAHRERQKADGWKQKAFFLAPDTVARLARLSEALKVSEAATIAHALAKLEEACEEIPPEPKLTMAKLAKATPAEPEPTERPKLDVQLGPVTRAPGSMLKKGKVK
jgi:hypothetical protein